MFLGQTPPWLAERTSGCMILHHNFCLSSLQGSYCVMDDFCVGQRWLLNLFPSCSIIPVIGTQAPYQLELKVNPSWSVMWSWRGPVKLAISTWVILSKKSLDFSVIPVCACINTFPLKTHTYHSAQATGLVDLEKAINMSWHPTKTLLLPL